MSETHRGGFNYDVNGVVNVPIVFRRVATYPGIDRSACRQPRVDNYQTYGTHASLLVKITDRLTMSPSMIGKPSITLGSGPRFRDALSRDRLGQAACS